MSRHGYFALILLALAGCASIHLSDDPEKVRAEVRKRVPAGTPVPEAETYMKRQGFRLVVRQFKTFDVEEFEGRHTAEAARLGVLTNVTVIMCHKHRYVFPFDRRNFRIGLLYDENAKITDVLIQTSTTSL